MKRIILILIALFVCAQSVFSQIELTVKVTDTGGNPRTNVAGVLKFKAYPYSGAYLTGITVTHQGVGVYLCTGFSTFQLIKAYVNDTPNVAFGQKFSGDPFTAFVGLTGNQTVAGNKTLTGSTVLDTTVFTHGVNFGNHKISNILDPTTDADIGDRGYNDLRYGLLLGLNDWAAQQIFEGKITCMGGLDAQNTAFINFREPSNPQDAATKHYVDQQVALIPIYQYQESPNVLRLIPNGTMEANKVYTTWGTAMNAAKGYAGEKRRYTIEVKGAGTDTNYITISNEGIPGLSAFENYISIKGENQNIFIMPVDGNYYTVTADKVIIENIGIYFNDAGMGGDFGFNGFIFTNCYIKVPSGSATFTNCKFRGNNIFVFNSGTCTFANCKGIPIYTNQTPTVTGTYQIDYVIDPNID